MSNKSSMEGERKLPSVDNPQCTSRKTRLKNSKNNAYIPTFLLHDLLNNLMFMPQMTISH